MATQGTYYVGRVLKLGILDQKKLIEALLAPKVTSVYGSSWTFTEIVKYDQSGIHYIFGKLCKFVPEGEVSIVDTVARSEKIQIEHNLRIASSPFVYIPAHSGIAFLHVSSQIDQATFMKRFCDVVECTHLKLFVDCQIELVSDLKSFAMKLSSLDYIFKISANISPPNPLFSTLWAPLKKYLQERNADKMIIIENAPKSKSLNTELPELIQQTSNQTEEEKFQPEKELAVGDAAILMAADGYGKGKVMGMKGDDLIVIRTAETAVNFDFKKDPDPHELYQKANPIFEKIKNLRHIEHGE